MSTTTLSKSNDFTYIVELRQLERPAGAYSLAVKTVWAAAKDPSAERTVLQITLDRDGLIAMRDLINQEVPT